MTMDELHGRPWWPYAELVLARGDEATFLDPLASEVERFYAPERGDGVVLVIPAPQLPTWGMHVVGAFRDDPTPVPDRTPNTWPPEEP